jgi:hypothetical protein
METMIILLTTGKAFGLVFVIILLGCCGIMVLAKSWNMLSEIRKSRLKKNRWEVDTPLFTFPDSGKKVLRKIYADTLAFPTLIIWVDADWKQMPIEHCLYSEVWIYDPPECRRAKRGEYMGYVNAQGKEIRRIQYVSAEKFEDGKALIKTHTGDEYFIDINGEPLP